MTDTMTTDRYYSVSFHYAYGHTKRTHFHGPGLSVYFCTEEKSASKLLANAERLARAVMSQLKLSYRHQYAWPDGSLYMLLRTDRDPVDVQEELNSFLPFRCEVYPFEKTKVEPLEPHECVGLPDCKTCDMHAWRVNYQEETYKGYIERFNYPGGNAAVRHYLMGRLFTAVKPYLKP